MVAGATQTFAATVTGDATLNAGVTWTASVGTITAAGVYTAPKPVPTTAATITATSKTDTSKSTTATVTFTPISVAISPTTATMVAGATQTFTAAVTGDATLSAGVTWSASVGTITAGGVYTAPAVIGSTLSATVTATSKTDTTKTATAAVTLTPISVAISPTTATMVAGATQTFAATVTGDATLNAGVTWSASVGSITAGGVYTAATPVGAATATITATSKTDTSKSTTATVTLTPIAISITTTPVAMVAGATQTFAATVTGDATLSAGVTWTASVGSISTTGVYTAPTPVGAATATITATSKTDTSKSTTATVTLTPIVVTIPTTPTAIAGAATEAITATLSGDTTANAGVAWSITSGGGSLTAVTTTSVTYNAPLPVTTANAVITATSKTDTNKAATITIPLTPISLAAISPATASLGVSGTQAFTDSVNNDSSNSGVTWSIGSGVGTLTGSTTSGVTYNAPTTAISAVTTVTLTATGVKDNTKTTTATITLNPITVTIPTVPVAMVAHATQTFSATVSNDGSSSGVTWTASVGSITTGGVYTAPTPVSTTSTTITATSVKDPTKSATSTVPLTNIVVTISPSSATLIGGATQTFTPTVNGDSVLNAGVTWNISPATGAGTISALGVYTAPAVVTVGSASISATSVTDPSKVSSASTITLNGIGISFTTPTTGVVLDYGQTLALAAAVTNDSSTSGASFAATGAGTVSPWNVLGTNAPATTLTAAGSTASTVTVTATSAKDGTKTATTASITVNPAITFSPASGVLAAGTTNTAYNATITASGGTGTKTFALVGSLPNGLTLNTSTGAITGTITGTANTYTFTLQATDTATTPATVTSGPYTITVTAAPLVVTPGILSATYTVGTAITPFTVTSTGGTGIITYGVYSGNLPAGITLTSSTGVVSGTPTAPTITSGNNIAFKGTDSATTPVTSVAATITLTVNPVTLVVNSPTLPTGFVNSAYNTTGYQFLSTGGTGAITWTMSPANVDGLTLSTSGLLSGTPTATYGPATISVTATDTTTNQQQTKNITPSLTVSNALTVTTLLSSLPYAYTGQAYPATTLAASGGSGSPYTWTVTSGLTGPNSLATLNLAVSPTGVITGTPSATGIANFTVQVTDSNSHTASATFSITAYAPLTLTTPSASVPGPGTVSVSYTASIAALGGVPGYTYTVNGSVLAGATTVGIGDGLSITNNGSVLNITGTPTALNSGFTFTVKVADTANNTAGSNIYTIVVNNPLNITTTNSGLPYAYVNQAYTPTTLVATGGNGTNTWSVTSGLTGTNSLATLNLAVSPTGVITGTPSAAGTASFTVKVTDSASNTATATYTITAYTPLSLPAGPTPSTLPAATTTANYTGYIAVTGGSDEYTWTINGTNIGYYSVNLGNGLSASGYNEGNTDRLIINGTPSSTGTVSFTASVTDAYTGATTSTNTYTIAVSTTYNISGMVTNNNNCGTVPQITLTLTQGTKIIQTVTTDSNGNYAFTGANGLYTITPTISGPTSVFYPATQSVTVASSDITNTNFSASLGYTVSGTVSYSGLLTGQIYLSLANSGCGSDGELGTSISAPGTYTIRGVPPGTYTLNAFMDNLGKGARNASNPTGSTASVQAGQTNANVALTDASPVSLGTGAPVLQGGGGFNTGAVIAYNPISTPNNNGPSIEMATSYTLQWSTDADFTSVAGSMTSPAVGSDSAGIWMLNTTSSPSLTAGGIFYFRAYGTSARTTQSALSNVLGPLTISAPNPAFGNAVSGTVTFTGVTPTGPLGVGFFDMSTGNFYGEGFLNPVSAQAYTIQVPNGSSYYFVGILDQNNDGVIDPGDVQNTNNVPTTTISGPNSSLNLTLPTAPAAPTVTTAVTKSDSNTSYSLRLQVSGVVKQPVAVTLISSTNANGASVITPMDIALCTTDCWQTSGAFQYGVNIGSAPAVGDTYTFAVTYSDTTTGNVTATVTNVMNAFATLVSPTGTSSNDTPTFTWTDPANPSNYTYQFSLNDSYDGHQIWQIPGGNGSKSGNFTSSITSLTWGTDPTNSTNKPSSSLVSTQSYFWQITVVDSNNNTATTQTTFTAP
jgi:hypothetical protein